MRKETDLEAVKETLIDFLYMPIERTNLPAFIAVQHPIFESAVAAGPDGKIVDLMTQEGHSKVVKAKEKYMWTLETPIQCLMSVRQSYYLTFLKYIKEDLSLSDFSEMLGECWTEEENPNGDVNVSTSMAARWFRQADKKALMNNDEYEVYSELPETFTVYRGVTPGHNPDGMSWTRERDKAEWFANRFGEGYILKGTAKKEDVLAFFSRRSEEEIVIEAKNVKNKEEM